MNKIIKFTVLFVCVTIFADCDHYNDNTIYDNHPSKRLFIKQMKLMYEKDIIDFFPSIRQNPYLGSNCRAYNYSPCDDSTQSDFSACAYFSVNINSEMLDSLERMDYIKKIKYSDTLFTIDVPYMTYAESYRNPMTDSLQIPMSLDSARAFYIKNCGFREDGEEGLELMSNGFDKLIKKNQKHTNAKLEIIG